jgi:hypothetical protein
MSIGLIFAAPFVLLFVAVPAFLFLLLVGFGIAGVLEWIRDYIKSWWA